MVGGNCCGISDSLRSKCVETRDWYPRSCRAHSCAGLLADIPRPKQTELCAATCVCAAFFILVICRDCELSLNRNAASRDRSRLSRAQNRSLGILTLFGEHVPSNLFLAP